MFGTNVAKIAPVERAGVPRACVFAGLLSAAVTGYLVTANVGMALGFIAALSLFALIVLRPATRVLALVVLSVFIEKALQPLTISV